MASPNRKITDLPLTDPISDHRFVVATQSNNYQVPYSGVIGPVTGLIGDLSGKLIETGRLLEDKIDIVSGIAMDNREEFRSGFASLQQTHYFIHDIENDQGPIIPIYHEHTPTPNTILSGIYVNYGNSLQVTSRWDGTFNDYIGTGYVQEIIIPLSNITELGEMSRRFEGTINGVNGSSPDAFFPRTGIISGRNEVAWNADNGRDPYILTSSGSVSVVEMGPGPLASNIFIDDIALATPKAGQNLGESALKEDDQINIFIDYDFNSYNDILQEPTGIEVLDEGIAKPIGFTDYPLIDMGAGIKRATIPVTVSERAGDLGVSIRSISRMGTTGTSQSTINNFPGNNDSRLLDQLYPEILIEEVTDYQGRTDGLREFEQVEVENRISNWDANNGDIINYTSIPVNNTDITIFNTNLYVEEKVILYQFGIFNESENLRIFAQRRSNGAIDTKESVVKIANGPVVSNPLTLFPAVSAVAPNVIGTNAFKEGDLVNMAVDIDTQGEDISTIEISIEIEGNQPSFLNTYTSDPNKPVVGPTVGGSPNVVTPLGGDVYTVILPITISAATGQHFFTVIARNSYGTLSDPLTMGGFSCTQTRPSFSLNSITYTAPNDALDFNGSCAVNVTTANTTNILYTSIDGDVEIIDPQDDFNLKVINCINPSTYNITTDNVKVSLRNFFNGAVLEETFLVNVASKPLDFTINIPDALISSSNGENYPFVLLSDQEMIETPSVKLDPDQDPQSNLIQKSSSTSINGNNFELLVKDSNLKGIFNLIVSGKNLAGVETLTSTPSSYQISGFTERVISVHPHSLLQGLGDIGTTVTNPLNVSMENLSEAGAGLNGGTNYYYTDPTQTVGPEVSIRMDIDDGFTICSGDGLISSTGSFFFNLDFLSRAANADTSTTAKYLISEL